MVEPVKAGQPVVLIVVCVVFFILIIILIGLSVFFRNQAVECESDESLLCPDYICPNGVKLPRHNQK